MDAKKLKKILSDHAKWINDGGGECADLQDANLQDADLQYANLRDANLRDADLQDADLQGANLRYADLQDADLRDANLRYANLQDANLRYANLRDANLQDADLDFSCWPLWCGSKNIKVDRRIAAQLAAHFCVLDCDDPDYQKARKDILDFAKSSHRAEDLGLK